MSESPSDTLTRLLTAEGAEEKEVAWEAFLAEHSRLLHLAARKSASTYDDVMDRYAYVLEGLRRDDFSRLRAFDAAGRSRFATWLVVVASRLCVDFHRAKYGRVPDAQRDWDGVKQRRQLVDLVGERIDSLPLADPSTLAADEQLMRKELRERLVEALDGLDPEDRLLVRLRFEDGRSMREAARILGLSSEFVGYRRLRTILANLRDALRRRGIDGHSA